MAGLDPGALINSIRDAATGILQKDISEIRGFSESQLRKMAEQAQFIAEQTALGTFKDNEELRAMFVKGLEDNSRNFVLVMEGLVALTAEKLWNAVVKTVWSAIGSATGAALPLPIKGLFGGLFTGGPLGKP
jgi:hypothetical protein